MENTDGCRNFEFMSFKDFENWKCNEENITNTRFVKAKGDGKCKGYVTKHFKCHRSGKYVPKGTGERHLKVQGSSKINSFCPAKIKVKCFETGNVSIRYFARHEGHTNDTSHLFIRKEQRQQIAGRLSLGVPFNAVIDHTRKEAGDDASLHLITKQHLKNIYRDYGLDNSILHQNDGQSVEAWVQLMKIGNSHIVRYVKFEDEDVLNMECDESGEVECIEDECVQKDNIETSMGNVENLRIALMDECNLLCNENKDNPARLSSLLASIKKLRAQSRVSDDGAQSFSTSIRREPGNKD